MASEIEWWMVNIIVKSCRITSLNPSSCQFRVVRFCSIMHEVNKIQTDGMTRGQRTSVGYSPTPSRVFCVLLSVCCQNRTRSASGYLCLWTLCLLLLFTRSRATLARALNASCSFVSLSIYTLLAYIYFHFWRRSNYWTGYYATTTIFIKWFCTIVRFIIISQE